jgi:hypothetical protein
MANSQWTIANAWMVPDAAARETEIANGKGQMADGR